MDYSYLPNINGGVEDWLLRLRVCRLWESTNTRENTLISMDMVLIDEKVITILLCFLMRNACNTLLNKLVHCPMLTMTVKQTCV